MTGAEIQCRRATDDDWEEIWSVVSAVVRAGDTYMFDPDITEDEARTVWLHESAERAATYVAILQGRVVATAYLRPNHPGSGDHVANAGWMVDPVSTGQGIGRTLAEHVIAEARRLGFRAMQFNAVVATNERAIGLWQSMGFTIVGTVPNAFRHPVDGLVPIHIMHRDL